MAICDAFDNDKNARTSCQQIIQMQRTNYANAPIVGTSAIITLLRLFA